MPERAGALEEYKIKAYYYKEFGIYVTSTEIQNFLKWGENGDFSSKMGKIFFLFKKWVMFKQIIFHQELSMDNYMI